MRRGKRIRWRDSRNTLNARRKRRRAHRRDVDRSGVTYNPIEVSSDAARSGVRFRLAGAVSATILTLVSIVAGVLAPNIFGAIFGFTTGLCSFGAAVGLLMSARHEEEVHALAASMEERALLQDHQSDARLGESGQIADPAEFAALPEPDQTDGAI
ncbi:MAG: hypothetical protein ACQEVA_05805 [Myxococcota bacterium]